MNKSETVTSSDVHRIKEQQKRLNVLRTISTLLIAASTGVFFEVQELAPTAAVLFPAIVSTVATTLLSAKHEHDREEFTRKARFKQRTTTQGPMSFRQ